MRIILRLLFYIQIFFSILGCNEQLIIRDKYFNNEQIKDLDIILSYFENEIFSKVCLQNENKKECYTKLFSELKENVQKGYFGLDLSSKKIDSIFNKINKSTFDEIWNYNKSYTKTNTFKIVNINFQGKYMLFLYDLGFKHPIIKDYYEKINFSGDISPSLIIGIINSGEKLNTEDIDIRQFLAIHYITITYQLPMEVLLGNVPNSDIK